MTARSISPMRGFAVNPLPPEDAARFLRDEE